MAEAETELSIKKARHEKLKNDVIKAADTEVEEIRRKALELSTELAKTKLRRCPDLSHQTQLRKNWPRCCRRMIGRMAVLSPEGEVFELMAGCVTATKDRQTLVFICMAMQVTTARGSRWSSCRIRAAAGAALGLVVQPDVIQGLADKPGFRGRGLLGRFLYCLPKSLMGIAWLILSPFLPRCVM